MAVYTCPKGHSSTENDYCSECGAKIDGVARQNGATPPPSPAHSSGSGSGTGQSCPDCGVRREPGSGDYCEVCGYNFKTGAHGELPMPPATLVPAAPPPAPAPVVAAPPPVPVSAPVAPAPPAPPPTPSGPVSGPISAPSASPVSAAVSPQTPANALATKALGWEISITVDPSLKVEGSPDPPTAFEPVVAALRTGSNLIGRSSPRRGINPEVALDHDDAVSHRHALLEVHGDGALTVRDIGSSNGTSVNGKEIPQLEDVPLNDGDQVTLGHWTRLLVKAVR